MKTLLKADFDSKVLMLKNLSFEDSKLTTKLDEKKGDFEGRVVTFLKKVISVLPGVHLARTTPAEVAKAVHQFAELHQEMMSEKERDELAGVVHKLSEKIDKIDRFKKQKVKVDNIENKIRNLAPGIILTTSGGSKNVTGTTTAAPSSTPKIATKMEETQSWLKDINADVQGIGPVGCIKLREALDQKEFDVAKLLASKANTGDFKYDKVSLPLALKNKQFEIAELILNQMSDLLKIEIIAPYIKEKQYDVANFLMDHGVDINYREKYEFDQNVLVGQSFLDEIINDQQADLEIVKFLVKKGAEVTNTQLLDAFNNSRFDIVNVLIDYGADVNHKNVVDNTMLDTIVEDKQANLETVKFLVEKGAKVTGKQLLDALENDRLDIANYLIDHGANVDFKKYGEFDGTFLDKIFRNKQANLKTVEFLVDKGAKIDRGHFFDAMNNGRFDIAQYYINKKQVNVKKICLTDLAASKKNENIIKFLISQGANVNLSDKDNNSSPLYMAVANHNLEVAEVLIEAGADFDHVNNNGNSPFSYAIEKGDLKAFKFLIEARMKKFVDPLGLTKAIDKENDLPPLYYAIERGQLALVKFLVENKGVDVSGEMSYGEDRESLLHGAVLSGNLELVKFLVEHGARTQMKDREGFTPLDRMNKKSGLYGKKYIDELTNLLSSS